MKQLVFSLIFLASFLTINAQQILNCDTGIIEISEGICSDDSLRFIVTADIPCSADVAGFPTNSVLTRGELVYTSSGISQGFSLPYGLTTYEVVVPGCEDVTLEIINSVCLMCDLDPITISSSAAIPTLGQWGLISLSLLLFIFGLVKLRSGFISPVIRT